MKWALRIAATCAFVVFVNRSVGPADIMLLVRGLHPWPLCAAVLIGAGSFFLQMLRWRLILRSQALPCTMMVSMKSMFRGCLLAFITPGRIGELFRAVHLDGTRQFTAVLAVVEERSFAVITTAIVGIICMIAQAAVFATPLFPPLAVASIVFIGVVAVITAEIIGGGRLFKRSGLFSGYYDLVIKYIQRVRSLPFLQIVLLSAGAHLLLLLQTTILFQMFGITGVARNMIAAGQAFSFMLLLPFFIANIGLREYAFSLFLTRLAPDSGIVPHIGTIALGVATFILIINIIVPALVGLLWMYAEKMSFTDGIKARHVPDRQSISPTPPQECHGDTA